MTADPENTDEDTYEDDEQKTREGLTLSAPIDDFCPNSNLGNTIIHALILEDKIAAIIPYEKSKKTGPPEIKKKINKNARLKTDK